MIHHIFNSKLISAPWDHLIIDQVFADSEWVEIQKAAEYIAGTIINDSSTSIHCSSKEIETPMPALDIINRYMDIISANQQEILTKFNNYDPLERYYVHAQWGTTKNMAYKVHPDSKNKAMTFIVYVGPENAMGTELYSNKDTSSYHSTVEWAPNRGLMFGPKQEVTWHAFKHLEDSVRITLCFYLRRHG